MKLMPRLLIAAVITVIGLLLKTFLPAYMVTSAIASPDAWTRIFSIMAPLLLVAIGVHVALMTGRIQIGAEGIYAAGALSAASIASITVLGPFSIGVALVSGALAGAFISLMTALLREYRGVHEVITGILLNYLLSIGTRYLAAGPLRDPMGDSPQTIELTWTLPMLIPNTELNMGLIVGIVGTVVYAICLNRTLIGTYLKTLVITDGIATTSGYNSRSLRLVAFTLSGTAAGLAGAIMVISTTPFRRFPADFYGSGVGFDGLVVAMLTGVNALFLVPSALCMALLSHFSDVISLTTALPKEIGTLTSAMLFLLISIVRYTKKRQ